jgi:hypothetical protein
MLLLLLLHKWQNCLWKYTNIYKSSAWRINLKFVQTANTITYQLVSDKILTNFRNMIKNTWATNIYNFNISQINIT